MGDVEKRRVLEWAFKIIRGMQEETGVRGRSSNADMVINLQTTATALTLGRRTNQQVSDIMLGAKGNGAEAPPFSSTV